LIARTEEQPARNLSHQSVRPPTASRTHHFLAERPELPGSDSSTDKSNHPGSLASHLTRHAERIGSSFNNYRARPTGLPPGNPVTMDTGMSDGGNQDEINRLNNFITGGNENPTAMQPGPISRGEQEGGGGPLRSNLGNEMNVGGYVGYGLLQQFGLIPEQSDRSSGDPNHVDSSRSGTGGRNYGDGGSYSPPVESAPPGEPGPASTAGSQPPVGQRISPVAGEDPGATTEPLPGLYEGYAYEVGKTAKGEARAYSAFHRLPP
jgi:hypothetical protein